MATFNECSKQLEKGNTADTRPSAFRAGPQTKFVNGCLWNIRLQMAFFVTSFAGYLAPPKAQTTFKAVHGQLIEETS